MLELAVRLDSVPIKELAEAYEDAAKRVAVGNDNYEYATELIASFPSLVDESGIYLAVDTERPIFVGPCCEELAGPYGPSASLAVDNYGSPKWWSLTASIAEALGDVDTYLHPVQAWGLDDARTLVDEAEAFIASPLFYVGGSGPANERIPVSVAGLWAARQYLAALERAEERAVAAGVELYGDEDPIGDVHATADAVAWMVAIRALDEQIGRHASSGFSDEDDATYLHMPDAVDADALAYWLSEYADGDAEEAAVAAWVATRYK